LVEDSESSPPSHQKNVPVLFQLRKRNPCGSNHQTTAGRRKPEHNNPSRTLLY
jgi:hypothetical protein